MLLLSSGGEGRGKGGEGRGEYSTEELESITIKSNSLIIASQRISTDVLFHFLKIKNICFKVNTRLTTLHCLIYSHSPKKRISKKCHGSFISYPCPCL